MTDTMNMAKTNTEAVKHALSILGAAWRGDWSNFDGRVLRSQLDEIAKLLDAPEPDKAYKLFLIEHGICPDHFGWASWCPTSGGNRSCTHLDALLQEVTSYDRHP